MEMTSKVLTLSFNTVDGSVIAISSGNWSDEELEFMLSPELVKHVKSIEVRKEERGQTDGKKRDGNKSI